MKARRLVIFSIAIATAISAQIPGGFTGAPFSATQTTERIQTLADGTHITQPSRKVVMYRDSAGRTRNEITFGNGRTGDPMLVMVQIMDTVAGFRYQVNLKTKVAQRFAMPVTPAISQPRPAPPVPAPTSPTGMAFFPSPEFLSASSGASSGGGAPGNPPKTTSETLGSQVFEGVTAEGTRTTTTWAIGSAGNDREIVVTNETWFSKQLRVAVLTKISDPRSGDETTKLVDISLVEPNPTLFMPPVNYEIKDMGRQ